MTQILGIIPARWASSRFPGKPLAMLADKPMIRWVYERASTVFEHLLVATDDRRIFEAVVQFGGKAVMTSTEHQSGTERCAEALRIHRESTGIPFSHVVNIQGDEPLIRKEQLETLIDCLREEATLIATLIQPLEGVYDLKNPNRVKVVVDRSFRALYFSRAPIPHVRDGAAAQKANSVTFYGHIGLYGFRSEVLEQVVEFQPTELETAENLEQLRWLEHGIPIQTRIAPFSSLGVDTPEDLARISAML